MSLGWETAGPHRAVGVFGTRKAPIRLHGVATTRARQPEPGWQEAAEARKEDASEHATKSSELSGSWAQVIKQNLRGGTRGTKASSSRLEDAGVATGHGRMQSRP